MSFVSDGYEVLDDFISKEMLQEINAALQTLKLQPLSGGQRNIDKIVPEVAALAKSSLLINTASQYLSGKARLVRAIFFDKTPENNWLVTWHQDRTVTVSEKFEAEGWKHWSIKDDTWHVQPPLDVLQQMVTIRVHLDASTTQNGCLKFIKGSQQSGLIASAQIPNYANQGFVYCEAKIGSAIVMQPLILHASEKARTPSPRRVLHFEYSSYQLPSGIDWAS